MAAPRGGRGWRRVGRTATWAALAAVCLTAPLLAWAAGQPAPALLLTTQPGDFPLGPHLEVLEDASGAWTVEQVCAPPLAAGFQPLGRAVLNLGLSRSAYWLRFSLRSPEDAAEAGPAGFWVLDFGRAFFHSLTLHHPQPDGGWGREESADPRLPLPPVGGASLRSLHLPAPPPGGQATYYVRVQSQMALILPLAVQTARAYLDQTKRQALVLGAYGGIMLAMAAYNFFLFITLRSSHQRLERRANIDALTGLYSANFFRERLVSELALAQETGRNLSLVLMDIDDFKLYNDRYGHPEGDRVLAALGPAIRNSLREDDLGCRYGGEEFALILPGASRDQAAAVAERVRTLFGGLESRPRPGAAVRVSVCAGVAQAQAEEGAEELMKRADRALYQAKAAGKDCTRAAD